MTPRCPMCGSKDTAKLKEATRKDEDTLCLECSMPFNAELAERAKDEATKYFLGRQAAAGLDTAPIPADDDDDEPEWNDWEDPFEGDDDE